MLPDAVIDELLAGAQSEEEITAPGGLLSPLTMRMVGRAMEVELTEHLGYEPHLEPPGGAGNTQNGHVYPALAGDAYTVTDAGYERLTCHSALETFRTPA